MRAKILMRSDAHTRTLPVLFLTASAEPSEREAKLEQGADDYLIKPVDLKELLAAVQRRLRLVPA
jgi:DNA-binding response OmpR family regulator